MSTTPTWSTLSLDQSVVLRHAAVRLGDEFAGVYGPETIERFLHSSFDQFATRSTIPTFLPLLAERFTHLAGDTATAWSGGSEPGLEVNLTAITAMAERGIDISGEFPKPWTDETVRAADVVITMGCGDACPVFSGKRYEAWDLADAAGFDLASIRPTRDDLERRAHTLLDSLAI